MRLAHQAGVAGSIVRLSPEEGEFSQSAMHPSGRFVAYWGWHPDMAGQQIWVADIAKQWCRPVTRGPVVHGHPAWWPDGHSIICFATQGPVDWRPETQFDVERPPSNLHRHYPESPETQQLTSGPWVDERPTVTPDGKVVIFVSNRSGTGLNLWALDVASGDLRQLTHGSTLDYRPVVAPDSQKIAYFTAGEGGRHLLALISWPAATPLPLPLRQSFRWMHGPWWAPDSRRLLVHGLTEGATRPALWLLDIADGACTRMALPGVDESSHGTWDDAQTWLAFDSRGPLRLSSAAIAESMTLEIP